MIPLARRVQDDGPSPRDLVEVAARAASGKLARDTVVLEVKAVTAIADYFLITSGANVRQVKTIVGEIEHQVKAAGGPSPLRSEGLDTHRWSLLDYGDFVTHVFLEEARAYYDLERLWADVPVLLFDDEPTEEEVASGR